MRILRIQLAPNVGLSVPSWCFPFQKLVVVIYTSLDCRRLNFLRAVTHYQCLGKRLGWDEQNGHINPLKPKPCIAERRSRFSRIKLWSSIFCDNHKDVIWCKKVEQKKIGQKDESGSYTNLVGRTLVDHSYKMAPNVRFLSGFVINWGQFRSWNQQPS